MASSKREQSKNGCWACKLRKKKCDERQISCALCLSIGIECPGYGPRPAWMDRGPVQTAKLEAWRQKVKETTNHKRKLKARQFQSLHASSQVGNSHEKDHAPVIPDSAEDLLPTTQGLPPPREVYPPVLNEGQTPNLFSGRSEYSTENNDNPVLQLPTPSTSGLDQVESRPPPPFLREEEAGLLMHYLDYVFPLQFPFYKHNALQGGRGWLLSLLMQLEPLHHAALSVSSYHQHFELFAHDYELRFGIIENARDLPACTRLESQLTEHNLTLSRLSTLLNGLEDLERSQSERQLPRYIELIACMATLISLEVSYFAIVILSIHV